MDAKSRLEFTSEKVASAGKWIVFSGTATYFLSELTRLLAEFEMPSWLLLVSYFVINVVSFAIAKYIEGENGK
jgi:uncharacterized membrane protein YcfT